MTPNHRVFSLDRGTWVDAGALRAGERLGSAAREGNADKWEAGQSVLVVARTEPRKGRVAVYNLEVSRYHTYFVGEHGVWVHNGCSAGGGARIENIQPSRAAGLQRVANKFGMEVSLVGSRANGTATAISDWDLIVPSGTTSRVIHSLKYELRSVMGKNIEVFRGVVDTSRPYIRFSPSE